MRGAWIIALAVGLLIIAILVMKNMGVDNQGTVTQTQAKAYTDQAKSAADQVNKEIKDIRDKMSKSE